MVNGKHARKTKVTGKNVQCDSNSVLSESKCKVTSGLFLHLAKTRVTTFARFVLGGLTLTVGHTAHEKLPLRGGGVFCRPLKEAEASSSQSHRYQGTASSKQQGAQAPRPAAGDLDGGLPHAPTEGGSNSPGAQHGQPEFTYSTKFNGMEPAHQILLSRI